MQLSLLFTLASSALAHHGAAPCANEHVPSHQGAHHGKSHHAKKPCLFCPGACICANKKDQYPKGAELEHGCNVFTDVHTETRCVTQYDVQTSQETRTEVINHCQTATHVIHPEETYTLTRTESYVVWPAQTSFAENKCCANQGNCKCGPPCASHGRHGCCK